MRIRLALLVIAVFALPHIKDVGRLLLAGVAGARMVTVPGAGHIVNPDAPDAFNDALGGFLATVTFAYARGLLSSSRFTDASTRSM